MPYVYNKKSKRWITVGGKTYNDLKKLGVRFGSSMSKKPNSSSSRGQVNLTSGSRSKSPKRSKSSARGYEIVVFDRGVALFYDKSEGKHNPRQGFSIKGRIQVNSIYDKKSPKYWIYWWRHSSEMRPISPFFATEKEAMAWGWKKTVYPVVYLKQEVKITESEQCWGL